MALRRTGRRRPDSSCLHVNRLANFGRRSPGLGGQYCRPNDTPIFSGLVLGAAIRRTRPRNLSWPSSASISVSYCYASGSGCRRRSAVDKDAFRCPAETVIVFGLGKEMLWKRSAGDRIFARLRFFGPAAATHTPLRTPPFHRRRLVDGWRRSSHPSECKSPSPVSRVSAAHGRRWSGRPCGCHH
ncbi:hypothetical protein ACVME8_009531 [Bradyrhizobium diazoefficiens]